MEEVREGIIELVNDGRSNYDVNGKKRKRDRQKKTAITMVLLHINNNAQNASTINF